jgi:hypothetical protein
VDGLTIAEEPAEGAPRESIVKTSPFLDQAPIIAAAVRLAAFGLTNNAGLFPLRAACRYRWLTCRLIARGRLLELGMTSVE